MTNHHFDLVTLGESMLRFSPPGVGRIEQARAFDCSLGGAESNVAVALARMGKRAAWFSRLPASPLGRVVTNTLNQCGVDTSTVHWAEGERLGTYFVEFGSPPRPTRVWYDRADSAASRMTPADLPATLIQSATWLHLTGITPALSPSCQAATQAALALATAAGVRTAFDVNYRALLWSPSQAAQTCEPFCQQADLVFIATRDAQNLFNIDGEPPHIAQTLYERWGGAVVVSNGAAGVWGCDAGGVVHSAAFAVEIVDRVGAGDALAAGVLCLLGEGAALGAALRFGAALAALKMTIHGDLALTTRAEVEALLDNPGATLHR